MDKVKVRVRVSVTVRVRLWLGLQLRLQLWFILLYFTVPRAVILTEIKAFVISKEISTRMSRNAGSE